MVKLLEVKNLQKIESVNEFNKDRKSRKEKRENDIRHLWTQFNILQIVNTLYKTGAV